MKKWMQCAALLAFVLILATGCSSNAGTQPNVGPTESPSPAPAPEAQAKVFTLAGKAAEIRLGEDKIPGNAYFIGKSEKDLVLPLTEVCKALGWAVTEPEAEGPVEIKMTKDGAEEIVLSYTRPRSDLVATVGNVRAYKGGKAVTINEMDEMPFIDGMLYATEGFISEAVEKIAVKYDGETMITVEPSA